MNHQDLINTCIFEQIQGLLFSDLSGPLTGPFAVTIYPTHTHTHTIHLFKLISCYIQYVESTVKDK